MTRYYDPTTRTAAEWNEMATANARRSQESFDRCDTDGFLSQWANDTTARLYRALADSAERGGMEDFVVLADAEGNEIEGARYVETRYGWSWVHDTENGAQWFRESNHSNPAVAAKRNAAKGYSLITVKKPAVFFLSGTSTCLSVVSEPKRG